MRSSEFIKEANVQAPVKTGSASGVPGMSGPTTQSKQTVASSMPKPLTVGVKPIQGITPAGQQTTPQQNNQSNSTIGSTGASSSPPKPEDQMGQDPQQSNTQQTANTPQQPSDLQNDAAIMAKRLGMNPQQTQQFTSKIVGGNNQTPGTPGKTLSPQDMQKVLPKPGDNVNVQKMGQTKVMPTPPDEKGIKLDTTKQLGYPVIVDPRDVQR